MDNDTHETDGAAQAKCDREAIGMARLAAFDAVEKLAHLKKCSVVAALAYLIETAEKRKKKKATSPRVVEGLDAMRRRGLLIVPCLCSLLAY